MTDASRTGPVRGSLVIGAVGEPPILVELEDDSTVVALAALPESVDVNVLIVDANSLHSFGWAVANPGTPVLEVRGRTLERLFLAGAGMAPAAELRDPLEFIIGISLPSRR
jgi:hypothetical protein